MSCAQFSRAATMLVAVLFAPLPTVLGQIGQSGPSHSSAHTFVAPFRSVPGQTSLPIFDNATLKNSVERALHARVSFDQGNQTIEEFARDLREQYHLNVVVDTRALDDVGLGTDTQLDSMHLEGVELEEAIRMLLEQQDLCFYVRDVVLVITTPYVAENHLVTHVYPVRDLIYWDPSHAVLGYADFDTLIEMITSSIAPDSWDEVGGAGSIELDPYVDSLIISQTRFVHKRTRALIETLRKVRKMQPMPSMPKRPATNVGSVPYRPGTTPASGMGLGNRSNYYAPYPTPYRAQGGFF